MVPPRWIGQDDVLRERNQFGNVPAQAFRIVRA
jgi:hypothetical protein